MMDPRMALLRRLDFKHNDYIMIIGKSKNENKRFLV